jgi:hypothetical protein
LERKAYQDENEGDVANADPAEDDGDEKVWEEINMKDFISFEEKYTVCIDTIGQDRSLTDEQIKFAVKVVKDFGQNWEETEKENLTRDATSKVNALKSDSVYVENETENIFNEQEKFIEDMLANRDDIENDEQRDQESKVYKFNFSARQISGLTTEPESTEEDEKASISKAPAVKGKDKKSVKDVKKADKKEDKKDDKKKDKKEDKKTDKKEDKKETEGEGEDEGDKEPIVVLEPRIDEKNARWRTELLDLKEAKTICFPNILQGIFYLLGYTEEQICEVKTNKLWWKKAKQLINEGFFIKLFKYQPVGPKDGEFKEYQKINYIESLLSELAQQRENVLDEKVEAYSQTFIRLHQWLKLAIEVRRENVIKRILKQQRLKEERAKAIEIEEERKKDRESFFEDEKAKWEEEMQKKKELEEERKQRELDEQAQDEGEDEFADYDDDGKSNNN